MVNGESQNDYAIFFGNYSILPKFHFTSKVADY